MPQPAQITAKLPRHKFHTFFNRKEQRKAARVQKKLSYAPVKRQALKQQRSRSNNHNKRAEAAIANIRKSGEPSYISLKVPESILKVSKSNLNPSANAISTSDRSPVLSGPNMLSKGTRGLLAADDAKIEALEMVLGVKGTKNLPQGSEDDGLDSLLHGLDDPEDLNRLPSKKRKGEEDKNWLEKKRQLAKGAGVRASKPPSSTTSESGFGDGNGGTRDMIGLCEQRSGRMGSEGSGSSEEGRPETSGTPPLPSATTIVHRKNPYVSPLECLDESRATKCIPLSFRGGSVKETADLMHIKRQIQGFLNRLSEANFLSILGDVENLYLEYPHHHVTTMLLDLFVGLISDPAVLQDTFIILHAGFIAAIYKIIGTDFGAQAVRRIHDNFTLDLHSNAGQDAGAKKSTNIISLFAYLYNFRVIGSTLIYDFICLFLENFSEANTELLLRLIRNAGPQLRSDDPSSLKDIVLQIQSIVAEVGESNLSVRTNFMVETINNLKNNRMKTGIATSTISAEHACRMKKILGFLNQRNVRASEPLGIGLKDLQDTGRKGNRWLVGAGHSNHARDSLKQCKGISSAQDRTIDDNDDVDGSATDLIQLAREQRMNTQIRRSIFIAIMSATDHNDAYLRLMKLHLKRSQELEIPKILIHCTEIEKVYNPFYTFLARRICSDKKFRMGFQSSLRDLFKRLGEGKENELNIDEIGTDKSRPRLRGLVNLARMFGALIGEGGLGLGILKVTPNASWFIVWWRHCMLTAMTGSQFRRATITNPDLCGALVHHSNSFLPTRFGGF